MLIIGDLNDKPIKERKSFKRLHIHQEKESNNFSIYKLEWIAENQWNYNMTPRRQNSFEIIWIKAGSGSLMIDLEKFDITNNYIYCIKPGQLHCLEIQDQVKGYCISFSQEFLNLSEVNYGLRWTNQLNKMGHLKRISIDEEAKNEIEILFEEMIKEQENDFVLKCEILRGLLRVMLIYLIRNFEYKNDGKFSDNSAEFTNRFLKLIQENITTNKMVSDYARELSITPNYLNQIVKKTSGYPASYHIQQKKILEAKRQLLYFGNTMKEIAYSLGFEDSSHFSKFFKKNTGESFMNFKKEISRC